MNGVVLGNSHAYPESPVSLASLPPVPMFRLGHEADVTRDGLTKRDHA